MPKDRPSRRTHYILVATKMVNNSALFGIVTLQILQQQLIALAPNEIIQGKYLEEAMEDSDTSSSPSELLKDSALITHTT